MSLFECSLPIFLRQDKSVNMGELGKLGFVLKVLWWGKEDENKRVCDEDQGQILQGLEFELGHL